MSDFLYSSKNRPQGLLAGYIREIYHNDPPEVTEFHGDWGTLAVSRNLYRGFQSYETEAQVFVIIGGPVLNFSSNRFLTGDDPVGGLGGGERDPWSRRGQHRTCRHACKHVPTTHAGPFLCCSAGPAHGPAADRLAL